MLTLIESHPDFKDLNLESYKNSFVPYLYLDGHRSSSLGNSDIEKYKNGLKFFLRFGEILKEFGFKDMVTMVHTSRNCCIKERIEAIQFAIQQGLDFSNKFINESNFSLYGDINSYKNLGYENFYNFLSDIENNKKNNASFTHHILVNYSENWAINNLNKINQMPEVKSVIRFTKGYISGGWIPIKMQESIFIYSQIPSVSDFWSDDAIKALILIALKNWIVMNQYIGTKIYNGDETNFIHNERDIKLSLNINKIAIESQSHNRIIAFGVNGPILYEF